jgi:16S rRNA (cytosine967-C5)-methyltransferase
MTPGARLQAVLDIITEAAPHKAPLDQICSAYFRSRRYIGSKDRAYISDFVYATYRNYRKLEWLAQTQSRGNRIRLIVLFACILLQDWKLYDFQNYLGKGDYDMAPIDEDETEILRRVIGEKHLIDYPPAVANECPDWAYDKLKVVFGDSLNDEMAALNQNATVDLRVNTLKATRDEVFAELLGTGIEVEATPYSPVGLLMGESLLTGR